MSGSIRRILVVEDQGLIAADLEQTLTKLGYDVVGSASTGEDALAMTAQLAPDLVLMDVRLRGALDGIETAERIHASSDLPVVYLTANADEETIARAKRTSPFGYVVKPFNERELRAAIEIAIYRRETDRLLAEERAQRRAAEELKLLVDGVKDYAIFMLDATGRVASWNEGARRIKGYTATEILGAHLSIFLPRDGRPRLAESMLARAIHHGRAEHLGWCVRRDGSRFWGDLVVTSIRDAAGDHRGYGAVTRDLTEPKHAEQQRERLISELEGAVKARDEFLEVASHELKTPLTPLLLQLDSLRTTLEHEGIRSPRVSAKLDSASRQTARLLRLVDGLLDVAKIGGGPPPLETERFDLAALLTEVVARFATEAQRAGSHVALHVDAPIVGEWDRLRIDTILSNILGNAVKYGAGKPIEVGARSEDGAVRVWCADQGIGIADDALERIFGRFERAVSTRHFGGLGLGLFVARRLAEAHGGTIVAQSRPGTGSTFTLVLPLTTTSAERSLPHHPEGNHA